MRLLLLLGILSVPMVPLHAEQPNIILLLADDLGYGELSCQGNPQIPTPHIDSIAERGIRFTQGYVTGCSCSPSRAGMMTGKFPSRFGYESNPIGARNEEPGIGLPVNQITMAEMLQECGYTTGLIGKWHLGGSAPYHPYRSGFDEFFGFSHEGHYFVPPPYRGVTTMLRKRVLPNGYSGRWESEHLIYTDHMGHNEPDYDANNPITRGGQPVIEEEYLTDALTREAVDFIDRNSDRPFFLYLAYNAVHSPLQGKNEDLKRFAHIDDIHRRIFAAMLYSLDQSVGKVLKAVEENHLSRKTWIIFLSDNGGPTKELTSSNLPLRGGKGSMYEGGIRIPFLMSWPGELEAGIIEQRPIISIDLYATAAKLAGAKMKHSIDGVDLMPFLTGKKKSVPHKDLFWRQGPKTAFRQGDWKVVGFRPNEKNPQWELYHLGQDETEQNDLAKTHPEQLQLMIKNWTQYNVQMKDPIF